jgi:hypothetical protein
MVEIHAEIYFYQKYLLKMAYFTYLQNKAYFAWMLCIVHNPSSSRCWVTAET